MQKRAATAEETRRRLVDATLALHAERGILATKPADIAARANVALTTYYKHFPTLGDLVRACTTRGRELLPPPDPAAVAALPPDAAARVPRMVRTLFDYYEAREPWLYTGRTEERFVPELQPAIEGLRVGRDAFVRVALAGAGAGRDAVAMATALVDFWAWRTLRRDIGLTQEETIRTVTATLQQLGGIPGPGAPPGPASPPTT